LNTALERIDSPIALGEDFIGDLLAGQLSPHTARAYCADWTRFFRWLGHRELTRVTRRDLMRYRADLIEHYRARSANRHLAALRALFAETVRHGIREDSPADGLHGFRLDRGPAALPVPSREQARALAASVAGNDARSVRDRVLLAFLGGLGLRRDEAAQLRTEHLQTTQGFLVLIVTGKGSKDRTLKLTGQLRESVELVRRLMVTSGPLFRQLRRGSCEFSAQGLSAAGIYKIVKHRLAAVGVGDCSPHSLRRLTITEQLRAGCPLSLSQRSAGHSDPRTTAGYDYSWRDLDHAAVDYWDFLGGEDETSGPS
jgi:site-specific recombinase XerD